MVHLADTMVLQQKGKWASSARHMTLEAMRQAMVRSLYFRRLAG